MSKELSAVNVIKESEHFIGYVAGDLVVHCPECGFYCNHFDGMREVDGGDNYAAWSGRGDLIAIRFLGECGHNFELCFGFHKGTTFVFCRTRQ